MPDRFGVLLGRLRSAREAPSRRWCGNEYRWITTTLSQKELARRAAVDTAYVQQLERGARSAPGRPIVLRLAVALELGPEERAALLVAAGFWPWTDLDPETADFVLAAGLAIVAGDWRRLEQTRMEAT